MAQRRFRLNVKVDNVEAADGRGCFITCFLEGVDGQSNKRRTDVAIAAGPSLTFESNEMEFDLPPNFQEYSSSSSLVVQLIKPSGSEASEDGRSRALSRRGSKAASLVASGSVEFQPLIPLLLEAPQAQPLSLFSPETAAQGEGGESASPAVTLLLSMSLLELASPESATHITPAYNVMLHALWAANLPSVPSESAEGEEGGGDRMPISCVRVASDCGDAATEQVGGRHPIYNQQLSLLAGDPLSVSVSLHQNDTEFRRWVPTSLHLKGSIVDLHVDGPDSHVLVTFAAQSTKAIEIARFSSETSLSHLEIDFANPTNCFHLWHVASFICVYVLSPQDEYLKGIQNGIQGILPICSLDISHNPEQEISESGQHADVVGGVPTAIAIGNGGSPHDSSSHRMRASVTASNMEDKVVLIEYYRVRSDREELELPVFSGFSVYPLSSLFSESVSEHLGCHAQVVSLDAKWCDEAIAAEQQVTASFQLYTSEQYLQHLQRPSPPQTASSVGDLAANQTPSPLPPPPDGRDSTILSDVSRPSSTVVLGEPAPLPPSPSSVDNAQPSSALSRAANMSLPSSVSSPRPPSKPQYSTPEILPDESSSASTPHIPSTPQDRLTQTPQQPRPSSSRSKELHATIHQQQETIEALVLDVRRRDDALQRCGEEMQSLRQHNKQLLQDKVLLQKMRQERDLVQKEVMNVSGLESLERVELENRMKLLSQNYKMEKANSEALIEKLKELHRDSIKKKELEVKFSQLQEAHKDQALVLQEVQEKAAKLDKFMKTSANQEKIIEKLEDMLEICLDDAKKGKELEGVVSSLRETLGHLNQENDDLKRQIEGEMAEQVAAKDRQIQELEDKNNELQQQLDDTAAQLAEAKENATDSEAYKQLEEEAEALKAKNEELEKELEELRQRDQGEKTAPKKNADEGEKERLMLLMRAEKAETRITGVEQQMNANAKKFAKEISKLKMQLAEKEAILSSME